MNFRGFAGSVCFFLGSLLSLMGADDRYWLKNAHLEAGLSTGNGIRLEVLRIPGGGNVLRESADSSRGVKTWIMTPSEDIGLRDLLSESPAVVEVVSENEVRLIQKKKNRIGLRLEWRVRLDPDQPVLEIVHQLHYAGEFPIHVGIWILIAVAPETVLRVPFTRTPNLPSNFPNSIAVFPYTNLADNRISSTKDSVSVAIREGTEAGSLKVGIVQWDGSIDIEQSGLRLQSRVPYDPMATYPEGGSNVTLYASPANRPDAMGEAEHLGPLRILNPGQSIELLQTLRLRID